MTSSKSLRIMQTDFNHKSKEQITMATNDSLMSPPLTPTEATHHHGWYNNYSTTTTTTTKRRRKDFIQSYSKMVPYLRPNNGDSIFALNVYRDMYLKKPITTKKEQEDRLIPMVMVAPSSPSLSSSSSSSSPIQQKKQYNKKSSTTTTTTNTNINSATATATTVPVMKRKRVSSLLPTGKEAALAFDSIDIDTIDQEFYPLGWVPHSNALDLVPVKVCWKGAPLPIDQQPYHDLLHPVESSMASILRLSPIQYLRCKRTLILASRTLKLQHIPFTKSVAQKLCRVDVNKTSALWTAFGQLGWFDGSESI